tara:strand:- start:211 stop:435 length:225 start_codon:yes stop_codon:yes gene_type:complete
MDSLGGNGNGLAWYAGSNAEITNHPLYQSYSQTPIAAIDASGVKGEIASAVASAESAPILNYLMWVLKCVAAIA